MAILTIPVETSVEVNKTAADAQRSVQDWHQRLGGSTLRSVRESLTPLDDLIASLPDLQIVDNGKAQAVVQHPEGALGSGVAGVAAGGLAGSEAPFSQSYRYGQPEPLYPPNEPHAHTSEQWLRDFAFDATKSAVEKMQADWPTVMAAIELGARLAMPAMTPADMQHLAAGWAWAKTSPVVKVKEAEHVTTSRH